MGISSSLSSTAAPRLRSLGPPIGRAGSGEPSAPVRAFEAAAVAVVALTVLAAALLLALICAPFSLGSGR